MKFGKWHHVAVVLDTIKSRIGVVLDGDDSAFAPYGVEYADVCECAWKGHVAQWNFVAPTFGAPYMQLRPDAPCTMSSPCMVMVEAESPSTDYIVHADLKATSDGFAGIVLQAQDSRNYDLVGFDLSHRNSGRAGRILHIRNGAVVSSETMKLLNTAGLEPNHFGHVRIEVSALQARIYWDYSTIYHEFDLSHSNGFVGIGGWGTSVEYTGFSYSLKGGKDDFINIDWLLNNKAKPVNGRLDEFRVWDRAKEVEEIEHLRKTVVNNEEKALTLYWPMNEGNGYDLFDESPNMHHGELQVDPDSPVEGDYEDSDVPIEKVNVFSTQEAKTCWEENFVPGGNVCLNRDWKRTGICENYLGCVSTSSPWLVQRMFSHSEMDTSLCREYCLYHGYQYAGVREGHRCGCGNDVQVKDKDLVCDLSCAGDNKEMCGGTGTMSVYNTGFYVGCFKDKGESPAFPHRAPESLTITTLADCRRFCRGDSEKFYNSTNTTGAYFEFASVMIKADKKSLDCRCGESHGTYGTANNCKSCKDLPYYDLGPEARQCGDIMGKEESSSVYRTGPQTSCSEEVPTGGTATVKCPKLTRIEHVLFADYGSSNLNAQDKAVEEKSKPVYQYGDCLNREEYAMCADNNENSAGGIVTVQCPLGTNLVSGGAIGYGATTSMPLADNQWRCAWDNDVCRNTKGQQSLKCFARCCRFKSPRLTGLESQPVASDFNNYNLIQLQTAKTPAFNRKIANRIPQVPPPVLLSAKVGLNIATTAPEEELLEATTSTEGITETAQNIQESVQHVQQQATEAYGHMQDTVKKGYSIVSKHYKDAEKGFNNVMDTLEGGVPAVQEAAHNWLDSKRQPLIANIEYLGEKVKDGVGSMVNEIENAVMTEFRMMTGTLPKEDAVELYKTVMERGLTVFIRGVSSGVQELISFAVDTVINMAVELVNAIFDELKVTLDDVVEKIRDVVFGLAAHLASKFNEFAGMIHDKLKIWINGQWYLLEVEDSFKDAWLLNIRQMLSKVVLAINTKMFDAVLGVFGYHMIEEKYLSPGAQPGCDPTKPYFYPHDWRPDSAEDEKGNLAKKGKAGNKGTVFLETNTREKGIIGDIGAALKSLGDQLINAGKDKIKQIVADVAKLLPSPENDPSFPESCLVGAPTVVAVPAPREDLREREELTDSGFMSYKKAGTQCITVTSRGGGIVRGDNFYAQAVCPSGFSLLSGGFSLEGTAYDKAVSETEMTNAPALDHAGAWECRLRGMGERPGLLSCFARCCMYSHPEPKGLLRFRTTKQCVHPTASNTAGHIGTGSLLTTSEDCTHDVFQMLTNGAIQHRATKLCLHPDGNVNGLDTYDSTGEGTPMALHKDCRSHLAIFAETGSGSLKHHTSAKCLHVVNQKLVLHEGCTGARSLFDFIELVPSLNGGKAYTMLDQYKCLAQPTQGLIARLYTTEPNAKLKEHAPETFKAMYKKWITPSKPAPDVHSMVKLYELANRLKSANVSVQDTVLMQHVGKAKQATLMQVGAVFDFGVGPDSIAETASEARADMEHSIDTPVNLNTSTASGWVESDMEMLPVIGDRTSNEVIHVDIVYFST